MPTANIFADLIPPDLIGGENGAPAFQVGGGRFEQVPRAEVNTPTELGAFADLVPNTNLASSGNSLVNAEFGAFADLVPESPTEEAERALAETPTAQQLADEAAFKTDPLIAAERGLNKGTGLPIHEAMNAVRSFGAAAGKYIFNGLQGLELNRAKLLANPTPEMVQPQGDETILPDGSAMSKEQVDALERQYVRDAQAGVPDALAKAEYWKMRAQGADAQSFVDPELVKTVPARLAHTAGEAAMMGMEALIPGVGLPLMVAHGSLAAEAEARNAGQSPAQAEAAGVRSAIGLAIFGGFSKLAALGVARLLPEGAEKLTRFVAQFAGQEGANETSSRALAGWEAAAHAPEGQKVQAAMEALKDTTLEATTLNTVYALMHASKAAGVRPPVRPASAPEPKPAPEPGMATETARYAEPAVNAAAPEMTADVVPPGRSGLESQPLSPEAVRQSESSLPSSAETVPRSPQAVAPSEAAARAEPPVEASRSASPSVEPIPSNDWTQATAPPEVKSPRLLSGEKQGDLISSTQSEDFALVGEKGTDFAGRQKKGETEAQAKEEARLKQESEQELLDDFQQHQRGGGDELLDALKAEGSLPALSSDKAGPFKGELQNIREEYRNPNRKERIAYNTIFKADAGEIDTLTHRLKAKGFDVQTPGDLLNLVLERLRSGRPIYGNEAVGAMGILPPGSAQLQAAGSAVAGTAKRLKGGVTNLEEFHDFRRARLNWSARNQESTGEITHASKELQKSIPNPIRREAITNWIQAGGDQAVLAQRAAGSKNLSLRKGYEEALKLTPDEVTLAGKVRQTYHILRKRAEAHGIEINELDNYVNQIWRRSVLKDFASSSTRRLSTDVRFAKKRFHDSFFHGEQAGLRPETKDIAKLLPIYMNEVNNAISAKQFVAEMSKGKAQDGRPLLAPRGGGKVVEGKGEGDKGAVLMFPEKLTIADTADYKTLDGQPALHAWKWAGEENGKPILMKGDLAIHPEAHAHMRKILGDSAIREWFREPSENPLGDIPKAVTKFLVDDVQQIGKATMLGFLSPFHQVQEGTHAIGHKVNPFGGLPKINLADPKQRDWAQHGLMILPDRVSANQFREGLDGSSRNLVANALGKFGGKAGAKIKEWSDGYQHFLFHEYIPALKVKTADHILERNAKRYAKELAAGEVSLDQIKFLSAEQSNAAYGHLNYADMGRNPTLQHIAQIFLLAPDFLEARARFAGQAVKGAVTKSGREQLVALGTLAATQWVLARVLNKTLDDDYHFDEPFGVVVGNRKYTMRSVPEDIYKAYQDWRKFTTGRLSPLVGRGLLEGLSGINYRNEPTTIGETFTNIIAGMIPLTLQPATRGLTETSKDNPVSPFEQLLGSLGLHVSRFSPTSKVYHLAKEWEEANGLDKKKGLFPRSKYQQLRYALEDGDFDRARIAFDKLIADGENKNKIGQNFRASILHPFTGSQANDAKFRQSLSAHDRLIFDAAVKRRHLLLQRYAHMRGG